MSNKLDRYRGTFNTSAAFAEIDGINAIVNYRVGNIISKKNNKILDLEDHIDDLLNDNQTLEQNYLNLKEKNHQDVSDYNELAELHNDLIDKYNLLVEKFNTAKDFVSIKNTDLVNKDKIINDLNLKVDSISKENEIIQKKLKHEKNSNISNIFKSVKLIQKLTLEKTNAEHALKVFFTLDKIRKSFLLEIASNQNISIEKLESKFIQNIFIENTSDKEKGSITFDESLEWLKKYMPHLHKKTSFK